MDDALLLSALSHHSGSAHEENEGGDSVHEEIEYVDGFAQRALEEHPRLLHQMGLGSKGSQRQKKQGKKHRHRERVDELEGGRNERHADSDNDTPQKRPTETKGISGLGLHRPNLFYF